jgi:methyltransferase-like protein/2-polyprenyl-3-methyl-5-hydroxy-6-metoxy-1,4-benzoquinol methylase
MERQGVETGYDLVPYESRPYPQTHPDRLATVARLFGVAAPPPDRCAVLELGCAGGGNLIAMAVELPGSTFLGVDASARQVGEGQETIKALGLDNVHVRHADIVELEELGSFDYVICHGVFSWVPEAVQERILDICSHTLTERGVAYVSYNTYPGWHFRGMVREMMRYHAARFEDPAARVQQATALLDFLASSVAAKDGPYGQFLKQELELLRRLSGSYLFHEHLEENNEPLYFHRFVERAAAHGLRYLAEADVPSMAAFRFPDDVRTTLRRISSDQIQAEQYLDFLRNRMFRQTLLCRDGVDVQRTVTPERLFDMHIAAAVVPEAREPDDTSRSFRGRGSQRITSQDPALTSALELLGRSWPGAVPFAQLADEVHADGAARNALAERLLRLYLSGGPVELHLTSPAFVREVSDRPTASPLARLQAHRGSTVTNLRHETVQLSDVDRFALIALDTTRDRRAIVASIQEAIRGGTLTPRGERALLVGADEVSVAERVADVALGRLAASALLTA